MSGSYKVESIIERKVYSGKVLYLIKWKGLDENYATWQSVKILKDYRHLIKEFAHNNRNKKMVKNEKNQDLYFDDQKEQNMQTQKVNEVIPEIKLQKAQQNKESTREGPKIKDLPPIEIDDIAASTKSVQKENNQQQEKNQAITPFKIPKRRGRPPKKLAALLKQEKPNQQTLNQMAKETKWNEVVNSKHTQVSQTVKKYLNQCFNKSEQVFELGQQGAPIINPSKVDKQTNTDSTSKEIVQKQIKILLVEPAQHLVLYTVSEGDNTFKKYTSQEMLQMYPSQLIAFLQQSLFEQTKTTISTHLF